MELGCIATLVEFKFAGDGAPAGSFEGYAAVFNNIDLGGDAIEPGAFAKCLAQMDIGGLGLPPLYYNHDQALGTIGILETVSEDTKGLAVKGRLIGLDTEQGKMMAARMREGACKGMSFGYRVPPYGAKRGSGKAGEPARILKQIDLKEVSVVDAPMNPQAKIAFIKSAHLSHGSPADEIKTIREFESFLRDVGGFSHAAAKAIAAGGFKAQTDPRDEDLLGDHLRKRMSAIAGLLTR